LAVAAGEKVSPLQCGREVALEHPSGGHNDSFENGPRVGRGLADDAQDFGRRGLPLQRLLRLVEQPRVLNRDQRLCGEGLHQRDLLLREWSRVVANEGDNPDERAVLVQGRQQRSAHVAKFDARDDVRRPLLVGPGRPQVVDMNEGPLVPAPAEDVRNRKGRAKHVVEEGPGERAAATADDARHIALDKPEAASRRVTKTNRLFEDRVERRGEIAGRRVDRL